MAYNQGEESVFNMALAYLARIDKLLYKTQEAAINQDIDQWRIHLRAVYRELAVKLRPEERITILGDRNKVYDLKKLLDLNITDDEATFLNIDRVANNQTLKAKYKYVILYLLDALDVKIRTNLQKKGMLLPSKDDNRFAVTKR